MVKKNKLFALLTLASFILTAGIITSCSSTKRINKDFLYFGAGPDTIAMQQKEIVIHPYDMLSIQVFSKTLNQEQTAIFNILNVSNSTSTGTNQINMTAGYLVSITGTIEMPVIGSVKAAGLTKDQFQAVLVQKLADYVKNPTVIVRFLQFNVNVLGKSGLLEPTNFLSTVLQ